MKISKYITKYDYIAYYTKQPSMWFFTNAEIESMYEYELYSNLKKSNTTNINNWNNVEDENDNIEIEPIDSYNRYRELLSEFKNVDKNNYLIIEGQLIDQMSKKFIVEYFNDNYKNLIEGDFKIVDFDQLDINIEKNINETQKLISNNYLILFQPAFIDPNLQAVTKCDALVKIDNDIFIIETKATSSAKYHHILDLLFQKKVVEYSLKNYCVVYRLCLIAYEKLYKGHVSFIISSTINLKKSINTSKCKDTYSKQCIKIGKSINDDGNELYIDTIFDYCCDLKYASNISRIDHKVLNVKNLYNNFDNVISELWAHKRKVEKQLKPLPFNPHYNDKSEFKNTDMWHQLRKLYYIKGYEIFKYSGNIIDFSPENLTKIAKIGPNVEYDFCEFLRFNTNLGGVGDKNKEKLFDNEDKFRICKKNYLNLLLNLKNKKVYFDFESINPGIRVIDNSFPFTQVVTQCSIIVDHGNGIEDEICKNMMIDPNNIDINWFKSIIDSIYQNEQYSYIVYNKTFESNRLKEMANFINESDYYNKVDVINKNMFDLADFFRLKFSGDVIIVKELNGFFSIKCVLPLVEKYAPEIFELTKCKNYKTLEIGNGLVCQRNTLSRFYNSIDDQEWSKIVENSKIYCENDVRAMIAVEYFILNYLSNHATFID